jgi:hypothetical protein
LSNREVRTPEGSGLCFGNVLGCLATTAIAFQKRNSRQDWQNPQQADTAVVARSVIRQIAIRMGVFPDSSKNIFQVDIMRPRADAGT